jgi:hypothetical protein
MQTSVRASYQIFMARQARPEDEIGSLADRCLQVATPDTHTNLPCAVPARGRIPHCLCPLPLPARPAHRHAPPGPSPFARPRQGRTAAESPCVRRPRCPFVTDYGIMVSGGAGVYSTGHGRRSARSCGQQLGSRSGA